MNNLETINNEYFSRIWDITKEINENIRHYNDHQTRYRSIASQWLLGAFAAMGFVMYYNLGLPFNKYWLVAAIAFVASLGVYQLWRMDMLVFNTLISTFFNIGKDMEAEFGFLPPIKNRTWENMRHHNTGQTLFYFYYIIIFVFVLICSGITVYLVPVLMQTKWLIISCVVVLVFLRGLFTTMRKNSSGFVKKMKPGTVAKTETV